ncbi:MAG: hypothetical protein M0R46_12760 [Candidatus Muirbacterium halophilum]|nr:hypothetical protein [Candidatus Muirbacterium halophilum]
MINKRFGICDMKTDEGKLLLASLAILTTITEEDIINEIYGVTTTPDQVFDKIQILANKIYYNEEFEKEQIRLKRENKMKKLFGD